MTNDFAEHIAEGLKKSPKTLSSMYFYDDAGSRLFQRIMDLPEYYPTRTEYSIFDNHGASIVESLCQAENGEEFTLVELGAGDGLKTKLLLHEMLRRNLRFSYAPVDISSGALAGLTAGLKRELPDLRVTAIEANYATALQQLPKMPGSKAVLFLGSNIGNFAPAARMEFLRELAAPLGRKDCLLIGFDLRKDPRRIRAAYDDTQGVTAAFNLNLLTRINRELGADFDLRNWQHYTDYDPLTGAVRSYLVSTCAQTVHITKLKQVVDFDAWEVIHTENSYKFTQSQIEALADEAGLRVLHFFTDAHHDFADVVLAVK